MYCSIVGHQFKISKNVTYAVKEYKCKRCGMQVTTNGNGKLTLLTPKYKEINSILERIHTRRLERKQVMLDR